MSKIIVIVGPTGVGKTRLSITLAKKYNASIINADSTQIYKEANIGTAKVSKEEMENVPHYMFDMISLNEEFTLYDYQLKGREILNKLIKENKNIIIVGGTGLYVKALLYDYKLNKETTNNNTYDNISNIELKNMVDNIYIDNNIHVNNRKRLIRFLNHYNSTGEIIKNTLEKDIPLYDFTMIGLTTTREELYKYLEKRVYKMIDNGFIEEANSLKEYNKVYTFIGYKELIDYMSNLISKEEAIKSIINRTKKYAKRQYTWFNNQFNSIKWFNISYDNFSNTEKEVIDYLE